MADKDEEPIDDFDETNGIVQGLDGDDGGAIDPDPGNGLDELVRATRRGLHRPDKDTSETPYSEEGRP